jgi:hypothetical protein
LGGARLCTKLGHWRLLKLFPVFVLMLSINQSMLHL